MTRRLISILSRIGVTCRIALATASLGAATASYAIHPATMSSYIGTVHADAPAIMRGGLFAFAGGVIPRGGVRFVDSTAHAIDDGDLAFIADPASGRSYLRSENGSYEVAIQRELACPIARYVHSGTVIAYTVAMVANDQRFFAQHGMTAVAPSTYIAKELRDHEQLLQNIDLGADTDEVDDPAIGRFLLSNMNQMVAASTSTLAGVGTLGEPGDGTYINGDFNVTYEAMLTRQGAHKVVDFGGLPLRYYWRLGSDGKTPQFFGVETFTFPAADDVEQHRAIEFFHNVALMRWASRKDPAAFGEYLRTVCAAAH